LQSIITEYEAARAEGRPANLDGVEAAIAAAYWAGQESMRGKIVRRLRAAVEQYKPGRYWRAESRAVCAVIDQPLLGGGGRDDADELLDWTFAA
jgi:hypothetical protein